MGPPTLPGRNGEWKYSSVPSKERAGPPSINALFTTGPRFTGADQGSEVLARVATHRSNTWEGRPGGGGIDPGRLEVRNISMPSRRMAGAWSLKGLLSSATKTAGPKVSRSSTSLSVLV